MEALQLLETNQVMPKARKTYLDFIRILAVLCVVMLHVCGGYLAEYEPSTVEYVFANLFNSISRLGVPLFVMVSGALFLDEDKGVSLRYLAKKIISIVVLFYIWSAFYAVAYDVIIAIQQGNQVDFVQLLSNFILGHYHMWFLFMIIGLYLITPFLRCFVKRENKKLVQLFLLISLLVQSLPIFLSIFSPYWDGFAIFHNMIENLNIEFFCGYTFLYVLGWYAAHVGFSVKQGVAVYVVAAVALALIFLFKQFIPSSEVYSNLGLLSNAYCLGIFVFLSRREKIFNRGKRQKAIQLLSKLSFGVYIVHIIVLLLIRKLFSFVSVPVLYMIVVWLCTSILCFAICFVISKIPVLKKIVRG